MKNKRVWLIPVAFAVGLLPPWLTANLLVYLNGGEKHDWHLMVAMIVFFFSFTAMVRIIFGVLAANEK